MFVPAHAATQLVQIGQAVAICVIDENRRGYCAGNNFHGQAGVGHQNAVTEFQLISPPQ